MNRVGARRLGMKSTAFRHRGARRAGANCMPLGNECPPPSGGHELALVEDVSARAHQGRQMRVGVVGAEEQAPARRHGDADPRPRPAGVAAVGSSQSGFGDCGPFESRSVHAPITHHRPPRAHYCSPVAQSQGARTAPEHAERFAIRPPKARAASTPPIRLERPTFALAAAGPRADAHTVSYHETREPDQSIRLQRPAPLRPGGAGGRAQAPRHVHRVHRP